MKVADLVLRLQQLRPDADVLAYDPDTSEWEPITGFTVAGTMPWNTVELCTDDMNTPAGAPESPEKRTRRLHGLLDQIEYHLMGAPREVLTADIQAIHAKLQRMAWPGERPPEINFTPACNYPHCGCPFDHPGTEGWCAQGRPAA